MNLTWSLSGVFFIQCKTYLMRATLARYLSDWEPQVCGLTLYKSSI